MAQHRRQLAVLGHDPVARGVERPRRAHDGGLLAVDRRERAQAALALEREAALVAHARAQHRPPGIEQRVAVEGRHMARRPACRRAPAGTAARVRRRCGLMAIVRWLMPPHPPSASQPPSTAGSSRSGRRRHRRRGRRRRARPRAASPRRPIGVRRATSSSGEPAGLLVPASSSVSTYSRRDAHHPHAAPRPFGAQCLGQPLQACLRRCTRRAAPGRCGRSSRRHSRSPRPPRPASGGPRPGSRETGR